jgi:peptidoglycan hydrolase FlgJ
MIKKVGGFLPPTNTDTRDPKIMKAAQMYETQFLREMVRAMRKTVSDSELVKTNMAEKIFREQLDDEYVDQWVNVKGGVGLSNMIYDQIVDRYGAQLGIQKPHVPMSGDKIKTLKANDSKGTTFKIDGPQSAVHSPWSGKIAQSFKTPDLNQLVKINHHNGMNSLLRFRGETENDLIGKDVVAGEKLGTAAGLLEWTLNPDSPVEG